MNKILMTIFICICAHAAFAQKLTLDKPYTHSSEYLKRTLTVYSDSSFVYVLGVQGEGLFTYTGTWKRKCNFLLLSSDEPIKVDVKTYPKVVWGAYSLTRKQVKRLKIPVGYFYHNSCFLIKDDETIQLGFTSPIWLLRLNQ